ncbi:MotE family protein [Aurantimonas sp. MSK8Z-1]|uniref:MotE family protein n=1 Tax=Mangrovibrevibacter kandeliae TaxID=2968473 RepID=UPI002118AD11|nr:MotE family protein [Aurantimonas sp. MSK8Z-1]MCW4113701.1 MotE family protein [Aurantimonas sp. MSK8Z-1]
MIASALAAVRRLRRIHPSLLGSAAAVAIAGLVPAVAGPMLATHEDARRAAIALPVPLDEAKPAQVEAPPQAVLVAEAAAAKDEPAVPPQKVRKVGSDGTNESVERDRSEVERYCLNIADKAQDARYAAQSEQLKNLETQINQRIQDLEAKRAEYKDWLAQRQAFIDGASSVVVDIYAKMKPDAAAAQLAVLDRESAAAVLVKLKSRTSSAILSEMPAETAGALAALIVQKTMNGNAKTAAATPENPS